MTKNQKIEWVLTGLVIAAWYVFMFVALQSFELFTSKPATAGEVISGIAFIALCGAFIINYMIKTVLSFIRKDNGKLVPCVWIFAPAACAVITCFLANGIWSFNKEFLFFNIISVVFGIAEIIIVNWYFAVFYGKGRIMLISMILYNAAVWAYVLSCPSARISYVHNIYLVIFIPAVFTGYIEYAVRSRLSKNK